VRRRRSTLRRPPEPPHSRHLKKREQSHRPTRTHQMRETPNKVGCSNGPYRAEVGATPNESGYSKAQGPKEEQMGTKPVPPRGPGPPAISRESDRRIPSPIRAALDERPATARGNPLQRGEGPVHRRWARGGATRPPAEWSERLQKQQRNRSGSKTARDHSAGTPEHTPKFSLSAPQRKEHYPE